MKDTSIQLVSFCFNFSFFSSGIINIINPYPPAPNIFPPYAPFFIPISYPIAKITYITHDNQKHEVEVQNGLTVMEGAVQNNIPGIDADCGGGMACATCHVYVKEDWFNKIPKKEDGEEDMLDMAFEPKTNSRLSCQIVVSDEIDGLEVNIPSKQA